MKRLAAYLLLHLTNPVPTKQNIIDLLATIDISPDIEKLGKLFCLLEEKNINEALSPKACLVEDIDGS